MQETTKEEFKILAQIRELKKKLGLAEHANNIEDIEAERDRLLELVRICYE